MGKFRDYPQGQPLRFGHKIYPEDIAGLVGLPYIGNIFYVDPYAGSDSANNGKSEKNALATVAAAYDKCTSGKNDIVLLVPTGGTGRTSETTDITWAKRFTHLIGASSPVVQEMRSGMNFTGTTGTASSSITFSENGCIVKNICFNGTDDANVTVTLSGDYNSFLGCDFKGSQNSTSGDDTALRCLVMSGAVANYFGGSSFGSDSTMHSAANATVEFVSATSRNVWEDCEFTMSADAQTPTHFLSTGATGIQGKNTFKNCSFYAFYESHAQKVNAVFNLSAQATTADILMEGVCTAFAFDDWEATASNILWFQEWGLNTDTAYVGLAIHNT
jgi:hypothetical protein